MKITGLSTLHAIKADFHAMFPYLKLEFYRHAHGDHELSSKADQVVTDARIEDVVGKKIDVDFLVSPAMTVEEFESGFYGLTGLSVQVFRLSNGIWLQTSSTDSWTLEKQNGKGERSEVDYNIEAIDITDFDVN